MKFNYEKCKVMELVKDIKKLSYLYKVGSDQIGDQQGEKDLGLIFQNNLSPEKDIAKIIGAIMKLFKKI